MVFRLLSQSWDRRNRFVCNPNIEGIDELITLTIKLYERQGTEEKDRLKDEGKHIFNPAKEKRKSPTICGGLIKYLLL